MAGAPGGGGAMSEAVLYDAAGPRGRRRILVGSVVGGVLVALVVGLAVARLASKGVFEAERWQVLTRQDLLELIGRGLAATLRAAALAMVLAMAVGGLLAVARLSRRRWLAMAAGAWVELFRGLPLLLLILFLFLGLPAAGVTISTFWALVGGLTLYNSAGDEATRKKAVAALDKVLAADPNKADAYFLKGATLFAMSTQKSDGTLEPPAGTGESLQKYLELQPSGNYSDQAKGMLSMLGQKVETSFGTSKSKKK